MREFMSFIGSDSPAPLGHGAALVWSEEHRLIVNVPEGTQRFCGEIRQKLPKVASYLWTRCTVATMMGLPGVLFTVNDTGVQAVRLVGPRAPLQSFWDATHKAFFAHRTMTADIVDGHGLVYSGGSLRVYAAAVAAAAAPPASPLVAYAVVALRQLQFRPEEAKRHGVKPGKKFGMLKAGQCVDSDTIPGLVVTPEMVLLGPVEGGAEPAADAGRRDSSSRSGAVLLVDVDNPVTQMGPAVAALVAQLPPNCTVTAVCHLSAAAVVTSPAYSAAVASLSFPEGVMPHHFYSPQSGPPVTPVVAAAELAAQEEFPGRRVERSHYFASAFPTALVHRFHLHLLAPSAFPLCGALADANAAAASTDPPLSLRWPYSLRCAIHSGHSAWDVLQYPTAQRAAAMLSPEFRKDWGIDALTMEADAHPPPAKALLSTTGSHAATKRILFLGTGSAVPSKYRNVSSFLLEVSLAPHCNSGQPASSAFVLFDCGEGTLGQLRCAVGARRAAEVALATRLVFLSHMHADHNLGLLSFVAFRNHVQSSGLGGGVATAPLVVVGPVDFVHFALSLEPSLGAGLLSGCAFDAFPCGFTSDPITNPSAVGAHRIGYSHLEELCTLFNWKARVVAVNHPANAHAMRLDFPDGSSVVYSGDTRPCPAVVELAQGVGTLIHEATFEDSLAGEAVLKRHSTYSEAVDVAKQAHAETLLLTHFSQRYPKGPTGGGEGEGIPTAASPATCFAFDFMLVELPAAPIPPAGSATFLEATPLHLLANRMPAFQALLTEYDQWTEGAGKRIRQEEIGGLEADECVEPSPATTATDPSAAAAARGVAPPTTMRRRE